MAIPNLIRLILDFFYPIFKTFIPKKTYYYAACGGSNLALSWILFFVLYQFVFQKDHFYFEQINYTISAYTLTSFCCFIISFVIGFLLMRYVVFTESELKGNVQFFRYALSSVLSAILGWIILKLLIEGIGIYPTIANVLSSCIVVVFSYLMQRRFSFR
jgi:putative flippase GtrA